MSVDEIYKNKGIYKIFSKRITEELKNAGFKVIRIEKNKKYPQYDVYCFERTKEFKEGLRKILREDKIKKNSKKMNNPIYAEDILKALSKLESMLHGSSEEKFEGGLMLASMLLNISIDEILEIYK